MSQLTKSAEFGQPVSTTTWRRLAAFDLIAAAVIVAAAGATAIQASRATEQAAVEQPAVIEPGSRLDDYGLRHPVR